MTVANGLTSRRVSRQPACRSHIAVGLVCLSALAGCGSGSDSGKSFSAETRSQIEQIVDAEMAEHQVKGMTVSVQVPGQGDATFARGLADTATGRAMSATNRVRIASITKSFTATVALQLVDEGRLDLDSTLTQFSINVPRAAEMTIRQLLGHTSGLYTYTADETFTSTLLSEPETVWTPQQLVDLAIAHPANNAPGNGYAYSNTNYILLGKIIEQVTGNRVEDEIQRRIFDRLGMTRSLFPRTGECGMGEDYSCGYWPLQEGGFLDITRIEPSSHWTSGAIVSTVGDMSTWVRALATGRLLSAHAQAERVAFRDTGDGLTYYGLGILRYGEFLGHDGTLPGYDSVMYYLPSRQATFVLVANTVGAGHAPKDAFKRIVALVCPEAVAW